MSAGSDGKRVGDVCELFTYAAEDKRIEFSLLMPERVYIPKWRLANKGYFGISTIFSSTVYHLYESRKNENVDLFVKHCNQIINNDFDYSHFYDATLTNF